MIDHLNAAVAAATGLLAFLGLVVGWWIKRGRPWWQEVRADYRSGRDTLVGRPPVLDSITQREIAPALPGIGQRIERVETALVSIADQGRRLADLEVVVARHTTDIEALQAQALERVVARAESTQALRTIETAIMANPPAELDD